MPKHNESPHEPLTHLTKQDVARLCGVNPWTIDRWRKDPNSDFPQPVWLSDITPRWRRSDIEAWLSALPQGGVSPASEKRRTGRYARAGRGDVS